MSKGKGGDSAASKRCKKGGVDEDGSPSLPNCDDEEMLEVDGVASEFSAATGATGRTAHTSMSSAGLDVMQKLLQAQEAKFEASLQMLAKEQRDSNALLVQQLQ
eukprot:11514481-Karenia_brevis.AAC.1